MKQMGLSDYLTVYQYTVAMYQFNYYYWFIGIV